MRTAGGRVDCGAVTVATQPQRVRLPLPGASACATVRAHPLRCGEVLTEVITGHDAQRWQQLEAVYQ